MAMAPRKRKRDPSSAPPAPAPTAGPTTTAIASTNNTTPATRVRACEIRNKRRLRTFLCGKLGHMSKECPDKMKVEAIHQSSGNSQNGIMKDQNGSRHPVIPKNPSPTHTSLMMTGLGYLPAAGDFKGLDKEDEDLLAESGDLSEPGANRKPKTRVTKMMHRAEEATAKPTDRRGANNDEQRRPRSFG
ncbi:MAG: hypothetical protein LQ350_007611 [Teloschistes chrysophthalmus]|nr:MAG: hypothetical protein LQ350_007611 [Niorma chrysophthalma]